MPIYLISRNADILIKYPEYLPQFGRILGLGNLSGEKNLLLCLVLIPSGSDHHGRFQGAGIDRRPFNVGVLGAEGHVHVYGSGATCCRKNSKLGTLLMPSYALHQASLI